MSKTLANRTKEKLINRLPQVRGVYVESANLSRYSRFRVGGPAEVLFKPADLDDLQKFMSETPIEISITVIGLGSNILIRDGGVDGVVIRLGQNFNHIKTSGSRIQTGAGALDLNVAQVAQNNGLTGLEFLSGIPGSIGGTLRMNGGAYGREMADITKSVTLLDREGILSNLERANIDFYYRRCGITNDKIFVSAELEGTPGTDKDIAEKMNMITQNRRDTQPTRGATGGSTFKNPPGQKAWKLIDEAGCIGLRRGGAVVSKKHCNFLINDNHASASDLEILAETVRQRVFDSSGLELEWEIHCIGTNEINHAC